MRYYIVILVFGFSFLIKAQTKLTFNYDPAGNQILRELCLSGCSTSAKQETEIKEIEALKEEDLLKFSPEDVISYYPNPVKEELYIKWQLQENNYITSIQVFSLTGQLLKNYQLALRNDNQNIPFQEYPRGVYLVVLYYSSGDQKSIRIIKQ